MALHPALAPVAALIGTWRGDGRGEYPTITPFTYTEELIFTDVDKPFLHYIQRTWSPTGEPMHTETGYLRVTAEQDVEFILAQPTGQTELAEGSLTIRPAGLRIQTDRKSTRLNSSHVAISYAVFCLKKKKQS